MFGASPTTGGEPILGVVIETWERDGKRERHSHVPMFPNPLELDDMQYGELVPECRCRTRTDGERLIQDAVGDVDHNSFTAICHSALVTVGNTVGPGLLAASIVRTTLYARGFHKLVAAWYLESYSYLSSDAVNGEKKNLWSW